MGWNLFLALLPYGMMWILKRRYSYLELLPETLRRLIFSVYSVLWLLFLPNAPYMITDFIHLEIGATYWWLDFILLTAYAITGLYYLYLSIKHWMDLMSVVFTGWSKIQKSTTVHLIFLLCSIGVHLGRNLRYNSWDLLHHTKDLVKDSMDLFTNPMHYYFEWFQITAMYMLLFLGHVFYKTMERYVN
ncbi:hypothetical protein AAU57_13905 [Nonlabens sp. YIK11]|nr:hypothetical protein AAU57_13905 [Nonlabens sp. YIK11]